MKVRTNSLKMFSLIYARGSRAISQLSHQLFQLTRQTQNVQSSALIRLNLNPNKMWCKRLSFLLNSMKVHHNLKEDSRQIKKTRKQSSLQRREKLKLTWNLNSNKPCLLTCQRSLTPLPPTAHKPLLSARATVVRRVVASTKFSRERRP